MAELREDFDLMLATGRTPLDFGNRVRAHPGGLLITAANKMRSSSRVRAGFSGGISETVSFDIASAKRNVETVAEFLQDLPAQTNQNGRYEWRDVEGRKLLKLMGNMETSLDSWKANAQAIAEYIANRLASQRLQQWTVVLLANGQSARTETIASCGVRLTKRANRSEGDGGKYTIGRLVSPVDEMIDLTPEQQRTALDLTIEAWKRKREPKGDAPKTASGPFIRGQRAPNRGLLLIYPIDPEKPERDPLMGFAASFPFDEDAPLIDYAENSVRQLQEFLA